MSHPDAKFLIKFMICLYMYIQAAFSHFPQQRRLQGTQREEARTMLDLKVNKKLLQNHLSKTSGQVVLLKDLHNIAASSKDNKSSGIEEAMEELKKVPGI